MFDSCMHEYYRQWQFRHPYPEDFKRVFESVSKKDLDGQFRLLNTTGSLLTAAKKTLQVVSFFNLKNTHTKNYISILPAAGFNVYDGFMIGGFIHNYQLPFNRFSFFALPLFATKSKKFNGLAKISYSWYPASVVYRADVGLNAAKFSMNEFSPGGKEKLHLGYKKLVPFVRVTLNNHNPLSKTTRYIQFKSFMLNEDHLDFGQTISGNDTATFVNVSTQNLLINQLKFVINNRRILYPYQAEWQLEQHKDFLRAVFTGNYYFNYSNRQGGMSLRMFAGKFFYTAAKTTTKQFETDRFHLTLTGANGYEDYTYSNYFAGRNKFQNWFSQQIMVRDGGFKVTTDLLNSKVGKTDNWLIAANFSTDIPPKINPLQLLPVKIPLKVFADIGTYAEAWEKNADADKFLFDAGLQLSLFRETLNIYIPLIYSSVFKDYIRSTLGENRFLKTISFSIDIQNFNLQKLDRRIPF